MVGINSIKLFQFQKAFCQTMGIFVPQSNNYKLNAIDSIVMISLGQLMIALMAYILYDAQSMGEYNAVFMVLNDIGAAYIVLFITNWKLADILTFIENCEVFSEQSELNQFGLVVVILYHNVHLSLLTGVHKTIAYQRLSVRLDQICEWLCLAGLATLVLVILFPITYTGVSYYILDLGIDSFLLYPPTKYA